MLSAEVNLHAKGLFRLEESVALSLHGVRDHTPTFMESRPFYFLALYPAADADWVQYFTVSPLKLKVKSIPAQSAPLNGLKIKLHFLKDNNSLCSAGAHSHPLKLHFIFADK